MKGAIEQNDPKQAIELLDEYIDVSVDEYLLVRWAASKGHMGVLEKLFQICTNSKRPLEVAYFTAVKYDQDEIADFLYPKFDKFEHADHFLDVALVFRSFKVAKHLIDVAKANPALEHNAPIRYAVEYREHELVKYLMTFPEVNPADCSQIAIETAVRQNDKQMIKLLMSDKRVNVLRGLVIAMERNNEKLVKFFMRSSRLSETEISYVCGLVTFRRCAPYFARAAIKKRKRK